MAYRAALIGKAATWGPITGIHLPRCDKEHCEFALRVCWHGQLTVNTACAGCLAEHLDAVLAAGPELLSRFPWEWKAALLAVARRSVGPRALRSSAAPPSPQLFCKHACNQPCLQGVLEDRTLALLADAEMPVLDLAGAQRLTAAGVDSVLQGMPALRAADLSFPEFHSSLIGTLQSGCPQLEVLWLGGIGPGMGSRTIKALLQALPRLQHREAVGESWEDIAEDEGSGAQARAAILAVEAGQQACSSQGA